MATHDLIVQTGDGLLLPGESGEQRINHYTFYAAFAVPDEWKVSAGGKTLGTVPISEAIHEGALIVFAGRRWRIVSIDEPAQVIEVTRSASGRPPPFAGSEGAWIHDQVRAQMRTVYTSDTVPVWMDQNAAELLAEGREEYGRLSLADTTVAADGDDVVLCLFAGDRTLHTAAVALGQAGLEACVEGPAVRIVDVDAATLADTLEIMLANAPPAGADLAAAMANRCIDKWDWALDGTLSCEAAARRRLDPPAAWAALTAAAEDLQR